MAGARAERRLAAILAADVVGYSALVERDEAATLTRLAVLRRNVVEPLLAEHRGRLVKLIGDGLLAEFASVVDAAACALAIQARNDSGLTLRIGIHLGDVVVDGDDLMGDGVNLAARLEGLAEPGGVVVSGPVREQLHGQAGLDFASLGEPPLKNIARPVRVYRLAPSAETLPARPPLPVRPSIAVLPFDNLGGNAEQSYFSDGLSEDLITALSRFRDLTVLARHSSFALRGEVLGAVEIGRRLGVHYLLEGSVRRAGDRVRVTAQLIDATSGDHLWAERYDRALVDIFAVQDEIVATIAATLAVRIHVAGLERAKRQPTDDLAAYDCVLRGRERLAVYGGAANAAAHALFARAVALDPDYALARAFLALAIYNEDWGADAAARRAECLDHATAAVHLDPTDSRCHRILAVILINARAFERAGHHAERAVVLNPNDADAAAFRAYVLCYLGRPEEGLVDARRALALTPFFHPAWYWGVLARSLHDSGQHDAACAAFERMEQRHFHHEARLAACHTAVGRHAEAQRAVARALALKPDFASAAWLATIPYRDPVDIARLQAELVAAGLPP
ncbi:MAG: adenylate/guanylate cyclase domain-containing protein [Geminicoccaceae bacterium]